MPPPKANTFSWETVPLKPVPEKKGPSKLPSFPTANVANYQTLKKFVGLGVAELERLEAGMREVAAAKVIDMGVKAGEKPSNFRAVEGLARITMIFAKRSTSSVLDADEIELLNEHDIPMEVEKTPASFEFNSTYLDDPAMRKRIFAALKGFPKDIIQKTPASTRVTVSQETVDAIFQNKAVAEKLLPVVTTFSMKPERDEGDGDVYGMLAKVSQLLKLPRLKTVMGGKA